MQYAATMSEENVTYPNEERKRVRKVYHTMTKSEEDLTYRDRE